MGSLPNLHELSKGKVEPSRGVQQQKLQQQLRLQQQQQQPKGIASRDGRHTHSHQSSRLWENEAMMEHMGTYSPISCRSTRASAVLSWRRHDSLNSSAGASSVRRLIAAVRAAPSSGPRPPKKAVLRHCAALLLGHAMGSAAMLPILPLQAGLGALGLEGFYLHATSLGPALLAFLYAVATLASCFAPLLIQLLGTNLAIILGHLVTVIFVGAHLVHPRWYILLPSYALLGAWLSLGFLARTSQVNVSATNLAYVCEEDPEDPDDTRRECLLRRLNRAIKLAEDVGLAFGCLIALILLRMTSESQNESLLSESNEVCGAEYCPPEPQQLLPNESSGPAIPYGPTTMMLSTWLGLGLLALGLSCAFLDSRMKEPQGGVPGVPLLKSVKRAFQDPKLQLAAPLNLFIGLSIGFIFADFTQAYILCTMGGPKTVVLSFLSLAALQALAGATLSMLMRHVQRHLVVVVGVAFHACLLLVLVTWRPAGDDPALFQVIAAAWGVCNAIWETLIYTLLIGLHPHNSWQGPLATSLMWKWLGCSLALGLHGQVCTRLRIAFLAGTLLFAALPYIWLEMRLSKDGKSVLAPLQRPTS